jgi:heme/copper-type cytochrome/quinol oxidase subunit 2
MKKSTTLMLLFTLLSLTNANAKTINVRDVPALINQTYIIAFIFVLAFVLLAVIISNLIKFEGGTTPKDPVKRRMWFWILAGLLPVSLYLYNLLLVIPDVRTGPALNKFSMHPQIASGVAFVVYILIGFVLSKTMSRGKIGNWFPSKK